jgi:hypothetical protein
MMPVGTSFLFPIEEVCVTKGLRADAGKIDNSLAAATFNFSSLTNFHFFSSNLTFQVFLFVNFDAFVSTLLTIAWLLF